MADLKVDTDAMVVASMGFGTLSDHKNDILSGLMGDLGQSAGMAGGDSAGKIFEQYYLPAAQATAMALQSSVTGLWVISQDLMTCAFYYLALEDSVAARFMTADQRAGRPPAVTDPAQAGDCPSTAVRLPTNIAQGDSPGADFWDSPQGAVGQLQAVAAVWSRCADLVEDVRTSAQYGTAQLLEECQGVAFFNFAVFFNSFVGEKPAANEVFPSVATMANVVSACRMLSQVCTDYANDVNEAWDKYDWEPFFECGSWMHDRIAKNPNVLNLNDVANIFSNIPEFTPGSVDPPPSGANHPPLIPPLFPVYTPTQNLGEPAQPDAPGEPLEPVEPVLPGEAAPSEEELLLETLLEDAPELALLGFGASYTPGEKRPALARPINFPSGTTPWNGTQIPPIDPPQPPVFPLLSPADQQAFTAWADSLPASGYGGGNPTSPAALYQQRIAGSPERILPLPPGATLANGTPVTSVAADGLRPADGAIIDAKYVNDPGPSCNSPRTLEKLGNVAQTPWMAGMYDADAAEIEKYGLAIQNPANKVTSVEIDTNGQGTVRYWQYLLDEYGVPGNARYVP